MVTVSPTEPPRLKAIASSITTVYESKFGADVVFRSRGLWVGIQRKELGDLVNSVSDGRLGENLAKMKLRDIAVLLIEGTPKFSLEGELLGAAGRYGRGFTEASYQGVLWTVQSQGIWVAHTKTLDDTIKYIETLERWCSKERHTSLMKRPGPVNSWGTATNEDFARHMLMGLPGVGVEVANRVLEKFGRVPWEWSCTKEELMEVPGVGKKTADRLLGAFGVLGLKDEVKGK